MTSMINLREDAEEVSATNRQMQQIGELANELVNQQHVLVGLEERVKEVKAEIKRLEETALPTLLNEAGIQSFTMKNGATVSLEPFMHVSLSGDKKKAAIEFLMKEKITDVISVDVVIPFTKGQLKEAQKLLAALKKQGHGKASLSEDVNTSTFKKIVRELSEDSETQRKIDYDALGVYRGTKAVVKQKKEK